MRIKRCDSMGNLHYIGKDYRKNGQKEGWKRVGSRIDSPTTYLKDNDWRRRNGE